MSAEIDDVGDHFGDFRWWEHPNCLSSPECARLVPDLAAAIAELRDLYDDTACRELESNGGGALVFPLFMRGWFVHNVDELLQLGRDLIEYPGWRDRGKLVGELRSVRGWSGARFEVGVQAGLRRAGLIPIVEPATSKDATRPDFVVPVDGLRIGLELKGIADPDYTRNRDRLCNLLASRMYPRLGHDWRGDVTLQLSAGAVASLDSQHDTFVAHFLPIVDQEVTTAIESARLNTRLALPSVGDLVFSYPPWDSNEHYAGSYSVVPDDIDSHHLLRRALGRALDASKQLGAADVDLRIAVLWGSRSLLPAEGAAIAAQEQITEDYEKRWAAVPLDWIIFFNAHTLGADGGWMTNVGLCRLPHARHDVPRSVLAGLTSWGRWHG